MKTIVKTRSSDCLKQGDALLSLLFNFALERAIRGIQENGLGPKLNGTHQHLVYDDANLSGDNTNTIKRKTGALINASKRVGLLKLSIYARKYHNIKTANRSFENVTKFKYLDMKVTNQMRRLRAFAAISSLRLLFCCIYVGCP
jgi:hypothetical protein